MYELGDHGDYRASNMGSNNNDDGGAGTAILYLIGCSIGFFLVYVIGCCLVASYN